MKRSLGIGILAAICLAFLMVILMDMIETGRVPARTGSAYAATVSSARYTSSEVCGQCHTQIYKSWRSSLHALSIRDPIFQAYYVEAMMENGAKAKKLCLRCHAPTTVAMNDYDLNQQITKEGVTCDFCHTVTKVNIGSREKPFEVQLGHIKRGPRTKTKSPAHVIKESSLHKSAEFCGSCHEFKGENGVDIISTFSEWRASSYAKRGVVCQRCHMRVSSTMAVTSGAVGSGHRAEMHDIPGGHSVEQLRKAVQVKIKDIKQSGDKVTATIAVTNSGSGHYVPTGLPSRKLVLSIRVLNPDKAVGYRGSETFEKVMANAKGQRLTGDAAIMMRSTRIVSDNRLRPGETRDVVFHFTRPRYTKITIEAKVHYLYEPKVLKSERISVEMADDVRKID